MIGIKTIFGKLAKRFAPKTTQPDLYEAWGDVSFLGRDDINFNAIATANPTTPLRKSSVRTHTAR